MQSGAWSWIAGHLVQRRFEFAVVASVIIFELAIRSRQSRKLFSETYFVDLAYCLFYRMGIYALLMERPIHDFIYGHLTWHAALNFPPWLRVIAFFVAVDFAQYWVHRAQHAIPALWAIHQVHHSEHDLSMMSLYRVHPFDMWMRTFLSPLLWVALVGLPPKVWLPLVLMQEIVVNLSHLEVEWTFGPLDWLLVSPVSHAIHHSAEAGAQTRNLGMTFVIWDRWFGTADGSKRRPKSTGLPDWRVPDSPVQHFWVPIRAIFRHYRGQTVRDIAPLTPTAPVDLADTPIKVP
jgi:sterol desaturase/sphingolipid hydroxylase (fatty acid hydroxylase superfamily)